ncbi:DoxX family protein [Marinoscillum furvescens]|uniref:DoxX-like protein n=1 Tax=Marinoscillum furvescens DSM 4134 TaxID=1122208 RepID=A0A3D9KVV0_MARFU|nr:DoxX family protein [Marinoscillum furvescens]RED91768.1 DoxX-like protein [Marinoscillum furvescens DSM 4134]
MKIVNWILQGILAFAFFGAGALKLATPYAELATDPNMAWVSDFSATQIKIIAVLEMLGAIGVFAPLFLPRRFAVLMPLAATGLACVMVGAVFVHISNGEPYAINMVLLGLAVYITWIRRGALGIN